MFILRKSFYVMLASIVALVMVACSPSQEKALAESKPEAKTASDTTAQLKNLEKKYQATLGVYAIDTGFGETFAHNGDQRFAFASTIKAFLGGILLKNLSWDELNKTIMYTEDDLVSYSPITEKHVDTGMALKDIISAAIEYSDNTAANLMFNQLGGPKGFQEQLRNLGDTVTNSSRIETDLNSAIPGDIRDTSTPKTMAENLKKLLFEDKLAPDKLKFYNQILIGNATGDTLIRAGVPANVKVGDKSGAASFGTRNDVAVLYPPHRSPIILVVYSNKANEDDEYDDALIADAARVMSSHFGLSN
ncbi:beta-lactamase 1 [Listeria grandensis FSL F6-0971]|uniref:Beta-lactamase n=1 Tax=Listeria grandensis FSL F6-0971 TaxID=1265819 RepID=W7BE56_9LIST|nr:class A beta-lactamase [Listeria grandensis]EUJ24222.1 beta-lactamase 1 [Listeria grandensis FSL F6-0971]